MNAAYPFILFMCAMVLQFAAFVTVLQKQPRKTGIYIMPGEKFSISTRSGDIFHIYNQNKTTQKFIVTHIEIPVP